MRTQREEVSEVMMVLATRRTDQCWRGGRRTLHGDLDNSSLVITIALVVFLVGRQMRMLSYFRRVASCGTRYMSLVHLRFSVSAPGGKESIDGFSEIVSRKLAESRIAG